MAYDTLEIENHGAVRRILLAREAQRNAQSQQMLDELDPEDTVTHAVNALPGSFSAEQSSQPR